MKRFVAGVVVAALLSPAARAQAPASGVDGEGGTNRGMRFVPRWHMTGDEACYDFEGARKLLQIDNDYDLALRQVEALTVQVAALKVSDGNTFASLQSARADILFLTEKNTSLAARLLAETERANKAEASKFPTAWLIGLTVGGVLLGALGGVLLGVYVGR